MHHEPTRFHGPWWRWPSKQLNPALLSSDNFWIARRRRSEICGFFLLLFSHPTKTHEKTKAWTKNGPRLKKHMTSWHLEMFIPKLWISMISTNSWCFRFGAPHGQHLRAEGAPGPVAPRLSGTFRSVLPWVLTGECTAETWKEALEVLKMFEKCEVFFKQMARGGELYSPVLWGLW